MTTYKAHPAQSLQQLRLLEKQAIRINEGLSRRLVEQGIMSADRSVSWSVLEANDEYRATQTLLQPIREEITQIEDRFAERGRDFLASSDAETYLRSVMAGQPLHDFVGNKSRSEVIGVIVGRNITVTAGRVLAALDEAGLTVEDLQESGRKGASPWRRLSASGAERFKAEVAIARHRMGCEGGANIPGLNRLGITGLSSASDGRQAASIEL